MREQGRSEHNISGDSIGGDSIGGDSIIGGRGIGDGVATGPGIPPGFGRRRRGVRVTTAAVVALGLSLAGTGVAGAATTPSSNVGGSAPTQQMGTPPGGGKRPTAVGTVQSVGSDSFTL